MRLSQAIVYSNNVQPATLPSANANPTGNAVLSGWGAMAGNEMPNDLQTVTIPILGIQRKFYKFRIKSIFLRFVQFLD